MNLKLPSQLHSLISLMCVVSIGIAIGWLPLEEATLLIIGSMGGVLLLIKPVLSIYLLIPIIPFSPWVAVSVGNIKIGLMEIMLLAGLGIAVLQSMVKRQASLDFRQAPFLWPFLIFLVGVGLSWLTALSIRASFIETIKWVEMLLLYLFMVVYLPPEHVGRIALLIILTGLAQSLLGVYQFVFKIGPEGFLLFDGRFLRAYGSFGQPNPYAGYLGMVLPLALALLLWKIEETKTDFVNRNILQVILLMLSVGLLLLALFTTQSRSGWVAAIFASVVVLLMLSWVARGFFLVAGLAGTFIGLAGSFTMNLVSYDNTRQTLYYTIIQRFADAIAIFKIENIAVIELTDSNFATLERLAHWQVAWNMWRDNFWFGVGFGNYEIVYPTYAIGRWDDPLGHAHNYLFNLGAETGLIGVTCYLIFWILTFGVIWQAIKYSFGLNRAIIIGGLGILVHLHIHNLFDNLYVQGMYLHVAIILALISLCKENLVRVK